MELETAALKKLLERMRRRVEASLDIIDRDLRDLPWHEGLNDLKCGVKNLAADLRHCRRLVESAEEKTTAAAEDFSEDAEGGPGEPGLSRGDAVVAGRGLAAGAG
ncbi:MAG: hypothetical protein LBO05_10205 [Deltaproteobacteria bacterium]|jgi:hypothetical protein|nr:hypothetical protein [Deltaproteobacteria bacterium]